MSNKIKIKRSAIEGKVPVVADLELGELAINTYDGRLFLKKDVSGVESIVDINNTAADAISTLNLLKTVDGTGSGLDADLLDGLTTSSTNIVSTVMTRNEDGQTGIGAINFDGASSQTLAEGRMWYDGATGSFNLGMGNGNITQQIGEEFFVYGKASAAITQGQLIKKTGTVGASGVITFAPTSTNMTSSSDIIGVATEDIASGSFGRITSIGIVHGINTSGSSVSETWADNDTLYYNPSYAGGMTNVKPSAPNQKTIVATVINAGSGGSGSIQVEIIHGTQLGGTDSNVEITSVAANELLVYDSVGGYWKNTKTIDDLTMTGSLKGPSTFTIDPAGIGDNTGTVVIKGNLQIDGTTTTLNSTVLEVTDKNMILGNVSTPSDATADGGGITLKGTTDKTFNWVDATDAWTSSEHLAVVGGKNLRILGSSSGTIDLAAPAVAGSTTITFPATTGTVVTTGDTQTVTTAMMTTSGVSAATYGDAQNVAQFTVDVAGRITSAANVPIPKTIPVYTRTAQILVSAASGYVNVYGRSATTVVPLLV